MNTIYEKQCWCGDCRRNHVIKLYSTAELDGQEQARFFVEGDYGEQLMRYTVCGNCGCDITPHIDIDIVATNGGWKEVCIECLSRGLDQ